MSDAKRKRLFPTCVGVNRTGATAPRSKRSLPHVRGGEPEARGILLFVASFREVLVFNPNTGGLVERIPVGEGGPEYLTFGTVGTPTAVPEPSALALLGAGCLSLLLARRLRRS